jgi:8-oxo-dGTP pyrophosphatase MutT (NUDIX family)
MQRKLCNSFSAAGFWVSTEALMARIFAGLARLVGANRLPVQVAAVCYRLDAGSVEFLLVNTSSGKWTFPKGKVNPGLSPRESAALEAWEEAGATGRIAERHFGSYLDTKRALGHDERTREVQIVAYLLEVRATEAPPESGRNPSWFSPREAKRQLAEGRSSRYAVQIADIIDSAVDRLAPKHAGRASLLLPAPVRRRLISAR